jgi:threonine aldolase
MFEGIDLYSDTLTRPTDAMRRMMANAEVGDEQKGEDPTTLALEEKVAKLLGKSAARFLPSATMANEIAIRLHCEPGDELVAYEHSHVLFAEVGGPAVHAGVQARPIRTATGIFTADDVRNAYRSIKGAHYPTTKLVAVENTTNMGGGCAWSADEIDSVLKAAKELKLKTHLDGARLFNAAIKEGYSPERVASQFDTVTLCLSKGLGCPIGALLAFDNHYLEKVIRLKQLMGGAMRQSGILAAAGIYALDNNVGRLRDDHSNAYRFAKRVKEEIPALEIENFPPATNMIFFRLITPSITPEQFMRNCEQRGVRLSQADTNRFRAVTHLDISESDIERAIDIIKAASTRNGAHPGTENSGSG